MIKLYISTFISSTKLTVNIYKLSQLTVSSKFIMKNKNTIGEPKDRYGISLKISNFSDSLFNILIVVERF